jgi:hypothetical protein
MNNPIIDYNNGDLIQPISDTMGIDSFGNLCMRMTDAMSMDMVTGEVHYNSGWKDNEDEGNGVFG